MSETLVETTEICNAGAVCDGYFVVAPLSPENRTIIESLQDRLVAAFPQHSFWLPKGDTLHTTFAHVLSPDVTYS